MVATVGRVTDQDLAREYARALAHWRLAGLRLANLEAVAPREAWRRLEHYLGVSLQQTIRDAVARFDRQATAVERRLAANAERDAIEGPLQDLRRAYVRVETMVDFFADALATRATPYLGALLRACDHIATRGMAEILTPLGRQVPAALSYIDRGLGASILKAGLRLWDGVSENPVAAIKVTRHHLLRCTSVLHEAGHQVAHMLSWNAELVAAFRRTLGPGAPELAELYSGWASEISADVFAFVHTGYASIAALHDVVDGDDAAVFSILPGDPHPASDARLMLGVALCRDAYGDGPWDVLGATWRSRHPLSNAPPAFRPALAAAEAVAPEVARLLLRGSYRAFGGVPITRLVNPSRVAPMELERLEREAGASAFGSPYWVWNEAIRLLALTGYRAAGSADALRKAASQQERWMLRLGELRQAA